MRRARVDRRTTETRVRVRLDLDGRGRYEISTGIRFLDHMLELVTRHGGFDLAIDAKGDLDVDAHHTVEDVGIALGEAVTRALKTKRGINRAGYFVMPMDETLAVVAIDLSGRPHTVVDLGVGSIRPFGLARFRVDRVELAVNVADVEQASADRRGGDEAAFDFVLPQLLAIGKLPGIDMAVHVAEIDDAVGDDGRALERPFVDRYLPDNVRLVGQR